MKEVAPLAVALMLLAASCGGSSSSGGNGTITITGIASGAQTALSAPAILRSLALKAAPSGCPDDSSGGIALTVSPVTDSFMIAPMYVRFLKEGSADYYEIPGCTHATAAEADADAVTIGSSTTTICYLGATSIPAEAVATYDGIEMAISYVQMTVPLIVPQISPDPANYMLRIYFNDDAPNGILARDVMVYDVDEGKWGWVNWDNTTQLAYLGVDARPASLLDAFANDDFWCADCAVTPDLCPAEALQRQCSFEHSTWSYKDPVTISSRDDSGGTNFTLTGPFTIAATSETHTLSMAFNLASTLTAWASEDQILSGDQHIDVLESCGFHPLFPSVTVTDSKE